MNAMPLIQHAGRVIIEYGLLGRCSVYVPGMLNGQIGNWPRRVCHHLPEATGGLAREIGRRAWHSRRREDGAKQGGQ